MTTSSLPRESAVNHVTHREPAATSVQPLCGFESAVGEDRAVADRVSQRDGFGDTVEADLVRAGKVSRPGRGHVYRPAKTCVVNDPSQHERGARRRIQLCGVVGLVNPGANAVDRAKSPRSFLDDEGEDV